jgi:hypothetical protein
MTVRTLSLLAALAVGCTGTADETEADTLGSDPSCIDSGPNAPEEVSASQDQSVQVTLSWEAPVDALGYIVFRAEQEDEEPTEIGRTINTEFVDTGLGPAMSFWYTLIAANADGESCPSAPVQGTTSDSSE